MIDVTKYKDHIFDVIGAIHEVHRELGPGLSEVCYQEALEMQLAEQGIDFEREKSFHPYYHGTLMKTLFRLDFLCKGDIIVECKSIAEMGSIQRSQLFNYMRLTRFPCGILVNFAPRFATIERFFYDKDLHEILATDGHIVNSK